MKGHFTDAYFDATFRYANECGKPSALDMAVTAIPEVETVVGKAGRVESALDPAQCQCMKM